MSDTSYLADNIEYLMDMHGLSANSLQEKSGITQSTTSRILNGSTKNPRDAVLMQYVDFFGVSLSDLRYKNLKAIPTTINNGISVGGSNTNTGVQIGQASGATRIHGFSPVLDWDDSTPVDADEVEMTFYKSLGFACGHGAEGEAFSSEWRKLRFSRMTLERLGIYPDQAFAATAHDDSMTPTICDGDTIFVDRGRSKIKDGRIFAIEHGGLFYCKRLYNLPNGGVRIVSDNADEFPERSLSRGELEAEGFSVIGWVFSISRLERWWQRQSRTAWAYLGF